VQSGHGLVKARSTSVKVKWLTAADRHSCQNVLGHANAAVHAHS
jgi:hypothetical protein